MPSPLPRVPAGNVNHVRVESPFQRDLPSRSRPCGVFLKRRTAPTGTFNRYRWDDAAVDTILTCEFQLEFLTELWLRDDEFAGAK